NDTWTQSSNLVTPDWRSGSNWSMGAPPGPNDTAVFDSTARIRTPDIIGIYVTVQALQFNPGAPSYTITMSNFGANFGQQTGPDSVLILTGQGILNNSGVAQTLNVGGVIGDGCGFCNQHVDSVRFTNQADAAGARIIFEPESINVNADFSQTTGAAGDHKVHVDAISAPHFGPTA